MTYTSTCCSPIEIILQGTGIKSPSHSTGRTYLIKRFFLSLRFLLIRLGYCFLLKCCSESITYFKSLYETFSLPFLVPYFPLAIHHEECISQQLKNKAKQHLNLHCLHTCKWHVSESLVRAALEPKATKNALRRCSVSLAAHLYAMKDLFLLFVA